MDERIMITLIYGFTFLLVLYLQIISPKISRKNIFLGIKIPEDKINSKELKEIYSEYRKNNIIIGLISLLLLLAMTYMYFDNIVILTVLPFVYIFILFTIYLHGNKRVKLVKKEENWIEYADNTRLVDINYSKEREKSQVIHSWGLLPIIIVVCNIVLSLYFYQKLPNRIPIHWNASGLADGYRDKSFWSVMSINIVHIFLIVLMYFSNYSIYRSRHEIDRENRELSIKKHRIFINSWSRFLKYTLIGMQLLFTYINMTSLGIFSDMRYIMPITLIYTLAIVGWSIYLSIKLGQGGQRLKIGEESISNRYTMEDDDMWMFGNTIYYNPDDPGIFVEKRVGVGFTINMASTIGKIILIGTVLFLVFSLYIAIKAV